MATYSLKSNRSKENSTAEANNNHQKVIFQRDDLLYAMTKCVSPDMCLLRQTSRVNRMQIKITLWCHMDMISLLRRSHSRAHEGGIRLGGEGGILKKFLFSEVIFRLE